MLDVGFANPFQENLLLLLTLGDSCLGGTGSLLVGFVKSSASGSMDFGDEMFILFLCKGWTRNWFARAGKLSGWRLVYFEGENFSQFGFDDDGFL